MTPFIAGRRRRLVTLLALIPAVWVGQPADVHAHHPTMLSGDVPEIVVYKSRRCECCANWVEHMRKHGFRVVVRDTSTPARLTIQRQLGVPDSISSCHTSVVGRYVVQGHVPAADVHRLLREQPAITGIGVAFMPAGSPGMESDRPEPYRVIAFGRDSTWVFARH